LKKSIIRVVREKFLKKKDFEDPEAKKEFIEQLYVFLIGRVYRFYFSEMSFSKVFFSPKGKSPYFCSVAAGLLV
jgi:two-component SAPR family response regulator